MFFVFFFHRRKLRIILISILLTLNLIKTKDVENITNPINQQQSITNIYHLMEHFASDQFASEIPKSTNFLQRQKDFSDNSDINSRNLSFDEIDFGATNSSADEIERNGKDSVIRSALRFAARKGLEAMTDLYSVREPSLLRRGKIWFYFGSMTGAFDWNRCVFDFIWKDFSCLRIIRQPNWMSSAHRPTTIKAMWKPRMHHWLRQKRLKMSKSNKFRLQLNFFLVASCLITFFAMTQSSVFKSTLHFVVYGFRNINFHFSFAFMSCMHNSNLIALWSIVDVSF